MSHSQKTQASKLPVALIIACSGLFLPAAGFSQAGLDFVKADDIGLWLFLMVVITAVIVSIFWKRALSEANRKTLAAERELASVQSQLNEQTRMFRVQSLTDRLTGVYNRVKLDDDIAYAIKRARRSDTPFSIILLDLDHFKQVNDSFGHVVGDMVLKAVSILVKKSIRDSDIVGRWGEERFLIICPDTEGEGGSVLAERLRLRIERTKFPEIGHIQASFGVTAYAEDNAPDTIIARVDQALALAKQGGRNRVEIVYGVKQTPH